MELLCKVPFCDAPCTSINVVSVLATLPVVATIYNVFLVQYLQQ